MTKPEWFTLRVTGHDLECVRYPGAADLPTLVLLHEGLGSIALWRDFPERLAEATGCSVFVYSRFGYGNSTPCRENPRGARYMHREALEVLPLVLRRVGIEVPILVGHSDGGSIALIYAGGTAYPLAGVVTLAAHVFSEPVCIAAIEQARDASRSTDLLTKLARYHADPAGAFKLWCDAWLSEPFRRWNLERYLPTITAPLLVMQGEQDEYGTEAQVTAIAAGARGLGNQNVRTEMLADCGHSPHRDQREVVLGLIQRFVSAHSRS